MVSHAKSHAAFRKGAVPSTNQHPAKAPSTEGSVQADTEKVYLAVYTCTMCKVDKRTAWYGRRGEMKPGLDRGSCSGKCEKAYNAMMLAINELPGKERAETYRLFIENHVKQKGKPLTPPVLEGLSEGARSAALYEFLETQIRHPKKDEPTGVVPGSAVLH